MTVPAGILDELVVGKNICATFSVAEPGHDDDRHNREPKMLRGKPSPMTSQDDVVLIDDYRTDEAKLPDTAPNLGDLLLGMSARIPWIGAQGTWGYLLDLADRHLAPHRKKEPSI
jgi:hypothetical protein